MSFKKISPIIKAKPLKDINVPQLRSVHIDELIGKTNALPPKVETKLRPDLVKWEEIPEVKPWEDNITGVVYAINNFDPFGNNLFGLMLYDNQSQYGMSNQLVRVYLLNEDWSPQINLMGKPVEDIVSSYRLVRMMAYSQGIDLHK